ncbi:MAG: UbiA-like protein EboC [Bacteroidota bacterium]|nr:UbiA-like protein EboC [Bacteroidota bacterium]
MATRNPYIRLLRPANIVTSVADALAGIAIAGYFSKNYVELSGMAPVVFAVICSAALYAGGIVFNDVFDASLDAVERPERPIPSGQVSIGKASLLALGYLIVGIIAGFLVNGITGYLAVMIAGFVLLYDRFTKHNVILGPITMGLCRGLNLLVGISIVPLALYEWVQLAVIPLIYIFAITLISQGEVHGGGKSKLYTAAILYLLVGMALIRFAWDKGNVLMAIVFIIGFLFMIARPLLRAMKTPSGPNIGKAVKTGVIGIILLDAAWAAASGEWILAGIIVILLPLSLWLGARFAVT